MSNRPHGSCRWPLGTPEISLLTPSYVLVGCFRDYRDSKCDIRVLNKEISRKHAEIYVEEEGSCAKVRASRVLDAVYDTMRSRKKVELFVQPSLAGFREQHGP